jgi:hypothetical protein
MRQARKAFGQAKRRRFLAGKLDPFPPPVVLVRIRRCFTPSPLGILVHHRHVANPVRHV